MPIIKNRQYFKKGLSGQGIVALPTMLLIGGLVSSISIALTISVYFYVNSTSGSNLALKAFSASKSGIYDGLMKITRDKSLTTASYNLTVGDQVAAIEICRDTEDCGGSGKFKVTSIGSAFTRRKKMEAIVSVDSTTGVSKLELMREIAL
ncbi:hypothetical protein KJ671_03250 [Patescibacteria group bacterium]|nr:hypothetical protein [Patescibacteria group bacterium]